jgi:signal transduction histidine kinase
MHYLTTGEVARRCRLVPASTSGDGTSHLLRNGAREPVEVTLDLADTVPVIWADGHQIHQVVVNLVVNAIQAMRPMETRPGADPRPEGSRGLR